MLGTIRVRTALAFSVALVSMSSMAFAQELVPRAYWPMPNKTNLIALGYQYSTGDIVTDPTLPITGVESEINFLQVSYLRSYSLFARTANVQFSVPYTWGESEGFVEGQFRSRQISGLTDSQVRFSVNILGAPTMDAAEFQALRAKPRTIIGVSLLIQAPTGDYDADKLLNPGTNRWAVKPGVGIIWPIRPKWLLEVDLSAWIFDDNDDFLGVTKQQDPIVATEIHLVKRIRPGFWASLDATYYAGGRTTVDGELRDDRQENSRLGVSVLFPFKRGHAIKFTFSKGIATSAGGDFDNFAVNYLYLWRKRRE
jgi:hypothetical protein